MGAAFIVKPGLNRSFSVITFAIAQVAMDVEPGLGMLMGVDMLHGPTHTILGALIIACFVMLIAPAVCGTLLKKWNKEVIHYKLPWLVESEVVTKTALIVGALFGTLSHVALDSLMHHDIQPLLPFSTANPLTGLVTHDGLYQLCTLASVLGVAAWFASKWVGRTPQAAGESVTSQPLASGTPQSVWMVWVRELRFTWFCLFLLSVVPSLLYGSGIFSFIILFVAVLIGVPTAAIRHMVAKGSWKKSWRRLVVMVAVPCMAMSYVSRIDQLIPENATPITKAIESFLFENGHYPASLEMLTPKHLAKIPDVRFSLIQPKVTYRVTNGKPYLTIPSATGDVFAIYEYDFETKTWKHYS